ncbi:MAG: undecaprenyl-diphosphate phosphatase [Patescibacteria group bacterium]
MNEFFKAIVLGVVEGITEFLPISSTGHLIILNQWIAFGEEFTKTFDVVIQLGAIFAVVAYFWDRLWPFGKSQKDRGVIFDTWKKAVIGVLPALILGFLFGEEIEARLFDPVIVATMLFLGGILLILVDRQKINHSTFSIREMSYRTVLLIGLIQAVAMIPGTSRSAATIIGGIFLGLSRATAAEFSFFLAIPTMTAASGYTLMRSGFSLSSSELAVLATGFFVSFVVAWAVIRAFINYIQKNDFRYFGYYRIILGVVVFLYFFQG